MRDVSQSGRAFKRAVERVVAPLRARLDSLVEFVRISSYSTGAGAVGAATTDERESVRIAETYGLATRPPGGSIGVALAPGGETQGRIVIATISPAGRPETAAGDTVLWTSAGHKVTLEDAGPVTIEGKDGQTITLDVAGSITIDVASGKSVNVGDNLAVELVKATPLKAAMDAMFNAGVSTAPTPMAGNNGSLAFTAAKAAWDAFLAGTPIETSKAKGS